MTRALAIAETTAMIGLMVAVLFWSGLNLFHYWPSSHHGVAVGGYGVSVAPEHENDADDAL